MALKTCKECRKQISTEAKVCPNCGKKNPTASSTHPIVWAMLVIGIFVLIGSLSSNSSSSPSPALTPAQLAQRRTSDSIVRVREASRHQLSSAVLLCHQAAERRLKAPTTAKWHDDEAAQKDLGKGRSHIQLDVDAQNSFSAMLRTTVDCKTRQTSNGDVLLTSFDSWQR